MFADQVPSAFIPEIDLVLVDNHDAHPFPFLPAARADFGFDLRFENAPRMISCNGDRTPAVEVIATRGL